MELFRQLALHGFLQNRGMIAIAHHVKVAVAESIEAVPVNGRVQKFILAEHINGLVGDNRTGEQESVACLCAHPVHGLAGSDIVGFDLVALVRDNQVGMPCGQSLFQPPCGLIVYDHHLQGGADHVPQGIQLLGAAAGKNRQRIREGSKFLKFLLPYAKDGERGHDHHPANPARL